MGKTLGAILTIGAAVAVNAIPGVGQAISGALLSTFGTIGATVFSSLSLGLAAGALQSVGGLLGLGPGAGKAETASTPIKPPRQGYSLYRPALEE